MAGIQSPRPYCHHYKLHPHNLLLLLTSLLLRDYSPEEDRLVYFLVGRERKSLYLFLSFIRFLRNLFPADIILFLQSKPK
jgi:hypothetical protein